MMADNSTTTTASAAADDGFIKAKTGRRRGRRGGRKKEEQPPLLAAAATAGSVATAAAFSADKHRYYNGGGGGGINMRQPRHRRLEMNTHHQPIWQGLRRSPSTEWDHRSFSIIVAKADENAVGAGVEKIISERRLVASYNWNEESWVPTIVVPGAPKMFNPWSGGLMESRNEVMTIDEESFRIPNAPLEPLFTAVRLCQPNFKLSDVDIVADLNCLKKLLRFVLRAAFPADMTAEGDSKLVDKTVDIRENLFAGSHNDCEFRIDCQVLGDTIVMMRRESEHRGRAMGYGVGYLNACTKLYDDDDDDNGDHHSADDSTVSGPHKRITYVKFGGLRLLLRHKTLAAIYPNTNGENGGGGGGNKRIAPIGGDQYPSSRGWTSVRYMRGGYLGDHNELSQIEFASVSKERRTQLVIDKWLDMLFIGSDHLYFGQHVRGRFDRPTMRTRSDALDLSGLKPSDGRRILVILETVLEKIVRYGRRSASQNTNNNNNNSGKFNRRRAGGGGDDKYESSSTSSGGDTANNNSDPFSFAILSADECHKLGVFKIGPIKSSNTNSNRNNANGNNRSSSSPTFVSESMMAALCAEGQQKI